MKISRRQAIILALSTILCHSDEGFGDPDRGRSGTAFHNAHDERLARNVTIYGDSYGVPHIVGDSEEAAFFGYGYAQAEDHLERMMLEFRDAQGRLAEVQGVQALSDRDLHFVQSEYRWGRDYLQRLRRTKQGVIENRDKISSIVYPLLDAFALGVNSYIEEHRRQIPGWEDVEALQRTQRVGTSSDGAGLTVSAFQNPGASSVVIVGVKEGGPNHIQIVLHGASPTADHFDLYLTTQSLNCMKQSSIQVRDGVAELDLPEDAVFTLVAQ